MKTLNPNPKPEKDVKPGHRSESKFPQGQEDVGHHDGNLRRPGLRASEVQGGCQESGVGVWGFRNCLILNPKPEVS